jgi:hypothetical protein
MVQQENASNQVSTTPRSRNTVAVGSAFAGNSCHHTYFVFRLVYGKIFVWNKTQIGDDAFFFCEMLSFWKANVGSREDILHCTYFQHGLVNCNPCHGFLVLIECPSSLAVIALCLVGVIFTSTLEVRLHAGPHNNKKSLCPLERAHSCRKLALQSPRFA